MPLLALLIRREQIPHITLSKQETFDPKYAHNQTTANTEKNLISKDPLQFTPDLKTLRFSEIGIKSKYERNGF